MTEASDNQRLSKRALARLIRKGMKGDAKAFADLYQIFINTIYFNVSSTLIDKNDIEDAVQEVVVTLHKSLQKLKSPYAFHSYLYRITINVCNKYNQKGLKQQHGTLEEIEDELVDEKAESPSREFERKERDELVRQFIAKLPDKQRYALLLYYYHDLPYKSIAEALDISVSAVSSNINRAKKSMKHMLEEHENGLTNGAEGDESFKGTSLDSLFTAGFASAVTNALDSEQAEVLWQQCVERSPELAVSTAGDKTAASVTKALVASIIAALFILGAIIIATQLAPDTQMTSSQSSDSVSQQNLFIPEHVEIVFESSNPDYPESFNPVYAEIELSEGYPLEWLITNEDGEIVAQGAGDDIDQSVFDALALGVYQLEWRISDTDGATGIAYRAFEIVESLDPL